MDVKEKRRKWSQAWRERNKEYDKERQRKWRNNNKEKCKAYDVIYYQNNKERLNKRNTIRMREYRRNLPYEKRRAIHEKRLPYLRKYYKKTKESLFHILGHICVRCGEFDKRVLQVDHINGGGFKEKTKKGQLGMISYYVKHPEEAKQKLQVLCANCNLRKVYENYENNYRNKSKLQEQIKKEARSDI